MSKKKMLYRVIFANQGKFYEVYATAVVQSSLFGFIEIEELVFGENASLVVDPSEERLKTEFQGVKRSYIPVHAISRIDEVEKEGPGKIVEMAKDGSNVTAFPSAIYTPPKSDS
jgi:hypothetical protein